MTTRIYGFAVCLFFALAFPGCRNIHKFSFSPDGKEIVVGIGNDVTGGGIFLVEAAGAKARRLTFPPRNKEEDLDPVFSPDGSKIVFCRKEMKLWGWAHLYLMNSDGTNLVRLTSGEIFDTSPVFSAEGERIYFLRAEVLEVMAPPVTLFSIRLDGSELKPMSRDPFRFFATLSSSPDGENLLLTGAPIKYEGPNAQGFLHLIPISDTKPIRVLEPDLQQYLPKGNDYTDRESHLKNGRYSPDGNEIIFIGSSVFYTGGKRAGTGYSIYSYHMRQGNTEKIWDIDASYAQWPSLTPDGKEIYFCTGFPYGCDKLWSLHRKSRQLKEVKFKR